MYVNGDVGDGKARLANSMATFGRVGLSIFLKEKGRVTFQACSASADKVSDTHSGQALSNREGIFRVSGVYIINIVAKGTIAIL